MHKQKVTKLWLQKLLFSQSDYKDGVYPFPAKINPSTPLPPLLGNRVYRGWMETGLVELTPVYRLKIMTYYTIPLYEQWLSMLVELFYYYIPLQYSCMYFLLVGDFLEKLCYSCTARGWPWKWLLMYRVLYPEFWGVYRSRDQFEDGFKRNIVYFVLKTSARKMHIFLKLVIRLYKSKNKTQASINFLFFISPYM